MLYEYLRDLAAQMGVELASVTVEAAGCHDVFLVHLYTKGYLVNLLVYQSEIENLQNGECCDKFELKIRDALSHLKLLLDNNQHTDFWTHKAGFQ